MSMNWDPRAGEFPEEWFNEAFPVPGRDSGVFTDASLEEVFREFDSDRKGHLIRADARRILNIFGEAVSDDDLNQMMLLLDPDGSGVVTQEQFIRGFLFSSPLFQNPSIVLGSISPLPTRKVGIVNDDVQPELNRAAVERRKLFEEKNLAI